MLSFRPPAALVLALLLAAALGSARAEDVAEVKQLLRAGQTTEANARVCIISSLST